MSYVGVVERNGSQWLVEGLDANDISVEKDRQLMAEYVDGHYYFKVNKISAADLAVVIDLVEEFKNNINKRI